MNSNLHWNRQTHSYGRKKMTKTSGTKRASNYKVATPCKKATKSTPKQRSPVVPQRRIEILEQTEEHMKVKFLRGSHKTLITSNQDPAIALNIFMDNLQRGLNAVNAAAPVPLPAWIPGAYPVSMDEFISAVLQFVQQSTNGNVVDNFSIAPNSGPESMAVAGRFVELNLDPFVISVANAAGGFLARLHGFYDREAVQVSQNINLMRPNLALLPLPNQQAIV
jgi:hypothetical protein